LNQPAIKSASKIALAAIAALLIIAIIFFKERVLFADAAFAAYNIINNKTVYIISQRYGSFVARIIPYWQARLHFSVKSILIGYGISSNLFLLIVTALMVYVYKQYKLAILIAFYSLLIVSDSFYMLADTHVGIGWLFLCLGTTIYLGYKQVNIIAVAIPFILFSFLAVTTHFIVFIPAIFLWVYFILDKSVWPFSWKKSVFLSCLFILVIVCKLLLTEGNSYDSHVLRGVTRLSIQDVIDAFATPTAKIFFYRCIVNYWVALILFIVGIIYLAIERKIMLLVWTVISVAGYIALMGITYADHDANTLLCHIELEWQCLGLVAATPFVFAFLPKLKPVPAALVLVMIFAVRFTYIAHSLIALENRYQYTVRVMKQMKKKGIDKLTLYENGDINSIYLIDWAVTEESLLASAMDGDKPQLNFCYIGKDMKNIFEGMKRPRDFWNGYDMAPPYLMNHEYFNIDTTQAYKIMSVEDFFK